MDEEEKKNEFLNFECQSDDELLVNHERQFNFFYNNLDCGLGLGNNYPSFKSSESKTSVLEDVYTFDFQANYFLEQ